jgi:hypothetical protein
VPQIPIKGYLGLSLLHDFERKSLLSLFISNALFVGATKRRLLPALVILKVDEKVH